MKFTAVAALASVAAAATVADLPTCATTCALTAIKGSSCAITDTACLCKDTAYATALTTCVSSGCSAADQAKTLSVSKDICSAAGVVAAGAASSSAPASSASAASASTLPATKSVVSPVVVAATGGVTAPTNGTGYAGTTPKPYTGGADALKAGQWMGFFALVGLVAL
ncbi:hypothetical protein BDZ85DRAFT_279818 [Elsinoe ampelina]|uniref:CFEM domain-containing protein n=1 Tax=Elsinoe ampelina TaxID=302913 RepID=A0A6A6GKX8_9PEZI|nr:hypothetical protein BDZ85DRAFT_279818 [Elsinoe ampelina]